MIPEKRSKKELKGESSKLPGQVGEMAGEFNKTMGEVSRQISKVVEAGRGYRRKHSWRLAEPPSAARCGRETKKPPECFP